MSVQKIGDLNKPDRVPPQMWLIIAVAILVVLYSVTILRTVSAIIDKQRVFWLDDDMMISMNYGRSLATGNGLVWYPGENGEGYSNLGWVLVMAVVHLLQLPSTLASLPILILNVILAALVLGVTAKLIHKLKPDALFVLPITFIALIFNQDFVRWTIYGLETIFQTVLLLWLMLRVIDASRRRTTKSHNFYFSGITWHCTR